MSKKALNKDLFREIKKTRSRFVSILLLVMIAVSFLFGLRMAAPDMEASMDAYLDGQELMDVHIMSTLGLTQEDVDALLAAEGTLAAEGAYSVDALASGGSGQDTLVVKAISLGEGDMNAPYVTQGRLPQAADECLVEESLLETLGLELGDTITLDTGTGTYEGALSGDTFTVVGTGQSPLYVSLSRGTSTLGNGSVGAIVTLCDEAYALDYFTDIYIQVEGAAALNAYSDSYEDLIADYTDSLETLAAQREEARSLEIQEEAQAEVDDGWSEYYDAEAEANQELADALEELEDARAELDDGWADYNQGKEELADAWEQISDAQAQLDEAKVTLNDGEADYADGLAEYEEGLLAYQDGLNQYEDGYAQYQEGLAEYEASYAEYQAGLEAYEAGEAEYADGLAQYEAGETAYAEGLAQYEAGETAYTEGLAQYEAGETEYAEGLAQYESAWSEYEAGAAELERQRQALLDQGYDQETVERLLADQQAELDAAKAELEGTKATLGATRSQLDETKATLEASRTQLDETKATLEASRTQLDETKATLEASRTQLDETKDTLSMAEDQLTPAKAELDSTAQLLSETKATLDESKAELDAAKKQLADARDELDSGWSDYYSGLEELADARQEAQDGETELADAYTELTDGEAEYADGLADYEEGKAEAEQELSDARQELEDAQQEIDDLELAEWYILDRTANTGFASYQQDAERMTNLATLFPTVFFLVAALVCLTAMTRMVEEQRVEIGGLKALGYSRFDIARKYVGYGLLASVSGGVIGLVLGGIGIPWVIVTCWKVMYDYPGVTLTFSWPVALACLLAAVACCTLAVLVAALAALRATPAALMRPRAPQPGKRVWLEYLPFVWKRMSFSKKVTARNLFRYQKRFWMTVIGIAGCTGLMITGFGLRDSIMDVVDLQFENISTYSAVLYTDEMTEEETAALTEALEGAQELTAYAPCTLETVTLSSDAYSLDGNLLAVEDPDTLDGFWTFRDRLSGQAVEMSSEGALISEKTAELLELSVGDTVTVTLDSQRAEIPITGIVENYVQHYIYLTKDAYQEAFGSWPSDSQVLLSYPESADWESLGSGLLELDGVTGIYYLEESKDMIRNQLNGVYPAVIIIISAAAALAFVVLYNLSSINITERLRELATLKVLGFRDRELRDYVFRENLVLTLIGMALGLLMGKWFHSYLITTVEVELVMFGREAHIASYVLSLALTMVFALLVNLAAGKKLRKIDMVESLKTVE